MRVPSLVFVALSAILAAEARSQESTDETLRDLYCEQCPFDAPVRPIRRDGISTRGSTTVITAEDMRAMGVISVADMIGQLPANSVAEETDSTKPVDAAVVESPQEASAEEPALSDEAADEEID